jgi:hypothetical protein
MDPRNGAMFTSMLVPLDGAECSEHSLAPARSLAETDGADHAPDRAGVGPGVAAPGRRWHGGPCCDAPDLSAARNRWAFPGDVYPDIRHACCHVGCQSAAKTSKQCMGVPSTIEHYQAVEEMLSRSNRLNT